MTEHTEHIEHGSLGEALAAFQSELPTIRKDETAKVTGESKSGAKVNYTYKYADLGTVVEAVLPVLGKHGLSVTSWTEIMGNAFVLKVALRHETGDEQAGVWPLPDPTRTTPQQLGSAITYGRRYLTLALTGVFPGDEDDDGQAASTVNRPALSQEDFDNLPKERPTAAKPVSAPPAKDWSKATDAEVHEQHTKLQNLELDKAGVLYDWMAKVGLHERKVPYVGGDMLSATQVLAFRIADSAADSGVVTVDAFRDFADGRGLLKVAVSDDTTLGEELEMARDLAIRKDAEQAKSDTPDPGDA